jgi:hypothetical protein
VKNLALLIQGDAGPANIHPEIEKLGVVPEILLDLVGPVVQLFNRKSRTVGDVIPLPSIVIQPFTVRNVAHVEKDQEHGQEQRKDGGSGNGGSFSVQAFICCFETFLRHGS